MKTNLTRLTLIALLSSIGVTPAFAHEDSTESSSMHWLSHIGTSSNPASANQTTTYGYASSRTAGRAVTLDRNSPYLNVTQGETVQINVAGKSVTWTFDTFNTAAFPLANIIPGADGVTVYVAPDPLSRGG